jgi:hypothetical protein
MPYNGPAPDGSKPLASPAPPPPKYPPGHKVCQICGGGWDGLRRMTARGLSGNWCSRCFESMMLDQHERMVEYPQR